MDSLKCTQPADRGRAEGKLQDSLEECSCQANTNLFLSPPKVTDVFYLFIFSIALATVGWLDSIKFMVTSQQLRCFVYNIYNQAFHSSAWLVVMQTGCFSFLNKLLNLVCSFPYGRLL